MTKKTIIHVSLFSIWTLGKGKGIPSVYRPIKGLADNGYDNIYITQYLMQIRKMIPNLG